MTGAESYWYIFTTIAAIVVALAALIGWLDQRDQAGYWRARTKAAEEELFLAGKKISATLKNAAPTSA